MPHPAAAHLRFIPREIDDKEIARHVKFDPDSGQILVLDQRMLLIHGFTLAALRRELMERLGG